MQILCAPAEFPEPRLADMELDQLELAEDRAVALVEIAGDRPQSERQIERVDLEFGPKGRLAGVLGVRRETMAPRAERHGKPVARSQTGATIACEPDMRGLARPRRAAAAAAQRPDKLQVLGPQPLVGFALVDREIAGDPRQRPARALHPPGTGPAAPDGCRHNTSPR